MHADVFVRVRLGSFWDRGLSATSRPYTSMQVVRFTPGSHYEKSFLCPEVMLQQL